MRELLSLKKTVQVLSDIFLMCAMVLFPISTKAQVMSSSSYQVQADVLGEGGDYSSSSNYRASSSLSELGTSENGASTNYSGCSGFECTGNPNYVAFSVTQGTSSPGTVGAGVALGTVTPSAVIGSNGTSINSVFLTFSSSSDRGLAVVVTSTNSGLKRSSTTDTITSATATLVAGTAGYGICVASTSVSPSSPTTPVSVSPYNGTCNTTSGHNVGVVDATARNIITSGGAVKSGSAEILIKASASTATINGSDYADTLDFVLVPTY